MSPLFAGEALLFMLIGHALCDGPLQGAFIAKAKCTRPAVLLSHAGIHAGAVKLATGSWLLAGLELAAHAAIDHRRCRGRLSSNADQALHVGCKLAWAALLIGIPWAPSSASC